LHHESKTMPDTEPSGVDPAVKPQDRNRTHRRNAGRRNPKGRKPNTYAALDLGTNNCRLLIAKPAGDGFQVVDSYSKVVRLGKGLSASGRLSDESIGLAVDAIGVCARKMKNKQVRRWRCVATQACRQASNGEEFLKTVKAETGVSLEIISPRVEARLAVMGCLNLIDMQKDVVLVVDIGGGSTELSWVDVRRLRDPEGVIRVHRPPISAWASLPVGVVNIARDMASRDFDSRAKEPSIGADRAKLLVAGCAITDVLCEMWPSERVRVADRGLREGMLMGLMQQSQKLNYAKSKDVARKTEGAKDD